MKYPIILAHGAQAAIAVYLALLGFLILGTRLLIGGVRRLRDNNGEDSSPRSRLKAWALVIAGVGIVGFILGTL